MVAAPVVHVAPCPTAADAPRLPATYETGGFAAQRSFGWGCGSHGEVVYRWVGPTKWRSNQPHGNGYEEDRYALRGTRYVRVGVRQNLDISRADAERRYSVWLKEVLGKGWGGFANCTVAHA